MPTLTTGWQRWWQGRPTDARLGLVADGFRPPKRWELGDDDAESWETDSSGERRDPWVEVLYLVLSGADDGHAIFTFTSSSQGGRKAVHKLSAQFGKLMDEHPGTYPTVRLGVDTYLHQDRAIGRVKTPVFQVADRVEAGLYDGLVCRLRGEPERRATTLGLRAPLPCRRLRRDRRRHSVPDSGLPAMAGRRRRFPRGHVRLVVDGGAVYLCSLPNKDAPAATGGERHLVTRDRAKAQKFIERWDQAGRGTYFCVSTIRQGETRRRRETVAELNGLHVDVDYKSCAATPDRDRPGALPRESWLPPTLVVDSGNGLHGHWLLREATWARRLRRRSRPSRRCCGGSPISTPAIRPSAIAPH